MGGALAGLKVLDLSRVLAGPWATQLLAERGIESLPVRLLGVGEGAVHIEDDRLQRHFVSPA
jgi:crotonobetainyl-CoA:carnitine CoA-transferase CaiB-like acyl-CoA transferase